MRMRKKLFLSFAWSGPIINKLYDFLKRFVLMSFSVQERVYGSLLSKKKRPTSNMSAPS